MPSAGDRLLGEWWTKDREGRIRFVRGQDGTYDGISSYSAPKPDNPTHDIHNPNAQLRGQLVTGAEGARLSRGPAARRDADMDTLLALALGLRMSRARRVAA